MIINTTGGGIGANYKVIQGTKPSNPSMNTILVDTTTAISEHVFSPTTPSSPTAGMVWIKTGTSGNIKFNALKKNSIVLYPAAVFQYISGAWVNKNAEIYSGSWIKLNLLYLFNGTSAVDYSWKCNTDLKQLASGFNAENYVTISGGTLTLTNQREGYGGYAFTNMFLTNTSGLYVKIDMSKYTTMKITGTVSGVSAADHCVLRFVTSFGTLCTENNAKSVSITSTSKLTTSIDVSSLNSSY